MAEAIFREKGLDYIDVRDDPEYQSIDVDYVINGKKFEVKKNYHEARLGRPGLFFWAELSVGDNEGFWYRSKADYFMFFDDDGNGIVIKNTDAFRNVVTGFIENGDHGYNGKNRIDTIKDKRYGGYIEARNLRVYLDDLEAAGIDTIKKITKATNHM